MKTWFAVCTLIGVILGFFFNAGEVAMIATIWLCIGEVVGIVLCTFGWSSDGTPELITMGGWLIFGVALGITFALVNTNLWTPFFTPYLR